MTREQILEQALRRVIQVRDERDKVLMVAELALAASGSEPPVDEFNRALNIPASQSSIQQGAMPPDAPTPSVTELRARARELIREWREATVGIGNHATMRPLFENEREVARACAAELESALSAADKDLP